MAARHYDGRFWADGETAMHSHRTECHNAIKKLRREIGGWQAFAERSSTLQGGKDQAQRQIAAIERAIRRQEELIAEYSGQIAAWEARQANRAVKDAA